MFEIIRGTGFRITFENDLTLSVEFGGSAHCENYETEAMVAFNAYRYKSEDAEIGVFDKEKLVDMARLAEILHIDSIEMDNADDETLGYVKPELVAEIACKLSKLNTIFSTDDFIVPLICPQCGAPLPGKTGIVICEACGVASYVGRR